MDVADATLGKIVLTLTSVVFVVLIFWINTYPFIEEELRSAPWLWRPQWFLVFCALWGLCFVGALMVGSWRYMRRG